jgi:uncharacterized membrane protein
MEKRKIRQLTEAAVLTALILVLSFTPIGYLKIGTLSITFITIPVVVGAVMEGPGMGAVLGAVFGLTSFAQCFGLDAFGTTLLGINPIYTALTCLVPRILMGWLSGWVYRWMTKICRKTVVNTMVASLSGALLNTILFVSFLLLFFAHSQYIQNFGLNVWEILTALFVTNAVVEAIVCLIVGAAICTALLQVKKKHA